MRTDFSGKSQDFIDGYKKGYQKGICAKTKEDKKRGKLTDISQIRYGHWQYGIFFESESGRDDWDIECSVCGALIPCYDKEQSEQQRESCKYCYNCGAKMDMPYDLYGEELRN